MCGVSLVAAIAAHSTLTYTAMSKRALFFLSLEVYYINIRFRNGQISKSEFKTTLIY